MLERAKPLQIYGDPPRPTPQPTRNEGVPGSSPAVGSSGLHGAVLDHHRAANIEDAGGEWRCVACDAAASDL